MGFVIDYLRNKVISVYVIYLFFSFISLWKYLQLGLFSLLAGRREKWKRGSKVTSSDGTNEESNDVDMTFDIPLIVLSRACMYCYDVWYPIDCIVERIYSILLEKYMFGIWRGGEKL